MMQPLPVCSQTTFVIILRRNDSACLLVISSYALSPGSGTNSMKQYEYLGQPVGTICSGIFTYLVRRSETRSASAFLHLERVSELRRPSDLARAVQTLTSHFPWANVQKATANTARPRHDQNPCFSAQHGKRSITCVEPSLLHVRHRTSENK